MPRLLHFLAIFFISFNQAIAESIADRPRIIVLTDLSNEPDDEESLVRFLVYSNEFDVEGMIATTSKHLKKGPREDILHRDFDAYAQVQPLLVKHAAGYPTAEHLHSVAHSGQADYGMAAVGDGKSTAGSKHIIEVVDKADPRPVWISIWGGANTLAQALWDVEKTRDKTAVEAFVKKLRVYTISDQDDGGHWIRPHFPELFYICCPGQVSDTYWRSTWNAISGDVHNGIGVMHCYDMVTNDWLHEHVMLKHGPLGALYPPHKYLMEGDTPSFLGLINHGLGWEESPSYGGWGGRYVEHQPWGETRPLWTELCRAARDTVTSYDNGRKETSNYASLWRWREHFQNDFAARMDWCVASDFSLANHNPQLKLNGDSSQKVLHLQAKLGSEVKLSAAGSSDPDVNKSLALKWWIYPEASTAWDDHIRRFPQPIALTSSEGESTTLQIPAQLKKLGSIHVILEAHDFGSPKLWAYRRAVIHLTK